MWVLGLVLGLLFLFILLLAVPVDLVFHAEKEAEFKSKVRIGWMFNLIGRDIKGKKKPKKEKPKKKRRRVRPFIAMLRARGFIRRLLRFIQDIYHSSNIREFRAHLRIGTGDPADTGMLFALVTPAVVQIRAFTPLDIQILPDFQQAGVQGHLTGNLRFYPIRILIVTGLFALSPATIRAIKALVVNWRR